MIYFDNSATTKVADEALKTAVECMTQDFGNPSSLHMKGVTAENEITAAKKKIAKTLKENNLLEIVQELWQFVER